MGGYDNTKTLEENALEIARFIIYRKLFARWPGLIKDHDDARQDFYLFVLEHMDNWNPEKGALSTHVGNLFDIWFKRNSKQRRNEAEHTQWVDPEWHVWDKLEDEDGTDHGKSPFVKETLEKLPEELRETVELCWCYGVSQSAAAELTGVSQGTVFRRLRRARGILGGAAPSQQRWEKGTRTNPERDALVRKMAEAGETDKDIAKNLGCTERAVASVRRRNGIPSGRTFRGKA